MRSQFLVRKSRSLVWTHLPHRALLSCTRAHRFPRKPTSTSSHVPAPSIISNVQPSQPLSTSTTSEAPEDQSQETPEVVTSPPEPPEDGEKPKRRPRVQIPPGFEILWTPSQDPDATFTTPHLSNPALPPPEIFHEVLTNLHITLHPQTQRRATYASNGVPLTEPTLALYCPIEGGDYVIDETVKELARQIGADVVVLDAIQLAGGESGCFGKAASVLQFSPNPLHFTASSMPSSSPPPSASIEEEEIDDSPSQMMSSPQLTLHVLGSGRGRVTRTLRKSSDNGLMKVKAFFDEVINVTSPSNEDGSENLLRKPRIIYIHDFPTLAASSPNWYPGLLAAVRQRRQGPLAKSNAPVFSPTTIIFGITPPIGAPSTPSNPQLPAGLPSILSMLVNRGMGTQMGNGAPKGYGGNYGEDEVSDKAREARLRERLRRWERGDSHLLDEIPKLMTSETEETQPNALPGIMIFGGGDGDEPVMSPPSGLSLASRQGGRSSPSESERSSRFFRTSVIVPNVRSLLMEKACRIDRRREINELTMRMGVASVGGFLERMQVTPEEASKLEPEMDPTDISLKVWEDWGRNVETWSNVVQVADRVVGRAIAQRPKTGRGLSSLDAANVDWPAVFQAWELHKGMPETKKSWILHTLGKVLPEGEEKQQKAERKVDEVVEEVRREAERGELDQHEQKLLSCVVDAGSMTTSFSQVHLPPQTIDGIRTIVSLPLLHPSAFQLGILKEHSMTGCLLFGPPGTGKTLVVRALAKEAGCRMLAISPSDVMDMYVGEAEKLVRAVFSLARRLSPCVVFIDEIDALFGARSSREIGGGDHVHRGVITEFMQEMDGLKSRKEDNIIVIGATNRPFDLDDAVLRRLPRRMLIDLPAEKEREAILKILLRDEILGPDVDLHLLARRTQSFSGSDLKHLCVAAALDAVKERVEVPWRQSAQSKDAVEEESKELPSQSEEAASSKPSDAEQPALDKIPRMLHWRNFLVALKEITPSSSEMLGSLADLRKWNEEFGEGRKQRKKQVWGKDKFGFTVEPLEEGRPRVQVTTSNSSSD